MRFRGNVKIVPNDFSGGNVGDFNKLANILNPMIDDLTSILNSGISITDNTSLQYVKITVKVDETFTPNVQKIPLSMKGTPNGAVLVNIRGPGGGTSNLRQMPFLDFVFVEKTLQLNKIYGLEPNTVYELTLLVTG